MATWLGSMSITVQIRKSKCLKTTDLDGVVLASLEVVVFLECYILENGCEKKGLLMFTIVVLTPRLLL